MALLPRKLLFTLCLLACTQVIGAGLFDKLTGGEKPKRMELAEGSDKAAVFKLAFADDGVFAAAVKPAEFETRKVAIGAFQVEFVTQQVATGAGSGSGMGGGSVEKSFTLKGTTDAQMVAITEKLHSQFKALLTQRGYTLVGSEALMGSAFKSALTPAEGTQADGTPVRKDEKDSVLGSARAIGLIGRQSGDTHGASVTVTAQGTAADVFDKYGVPPGMKAADELGAALLQVRLKVNFMQIDTSNTALFSVSEAEGKPRNMLGLQGSRMDVFWPSSKMAIFMLKKSLLLPGSAGPVTEIVATKEETAGKVASGALSAVTGFFGLRGGGGGLSGAFGGLAGEMHSQGGSGKYEVTADADYEAKLLQDLGLALGLYVEALPK
jgi:hypothetical protein